MSRIFREVADLPPDFSLTSLGVRLRETEVLMVDPEHFRLEYAINPHMRDSVGALHVVDEARARSQWEALRAAYRDLGFRVTVLSAAVGLPDMVFSANQSLAALGPDGAPRVVLSRMRAVERQAEVEHFRRFYVERDWARHEVGQEGQAFESAGDLLLWPERRFGVGGFGPRSDRALVEEAAQVLEVDLALVELVDPDFYHLDTALVPLDDRRALWVPAAFDEKGQALIEALVPELVVAPEEEARQAFATNAHCPDGQHVLIDAAATITQERLRAAGLSVLPVETSEFRKSGGSVFCMKLMLP